MSNSSVTVRFATNNVTIKVNVTKPETVEKIIALALEEGNLPESIVANAAFVKNSEDVESTDTVDPGDKIDVAPQVRNG